MGQGNHKNDVVSLGFFVQSAYLQSQVAMAYDDICYYDLTHKHFLALLYGCLFQHHLCKGSKSCAFAFCTPIGYGAQVLA